MFFEAHTVTSSVPKSKETNGLENGLIIVVNRSVGIQQVGFIR